MSRFTSQNFHFAHLYTQQKVKSYQRQFEDDAYELAQNGLLEKILELNELLTSRKLDIAYAPKVDVSALKGHSSRLQC